MANLQLTLEPGVPTGSPCLFDASDPDTQPIARLSWFTAGGWTREQQLEHGRRIVQCVNAHEALLAACKQALSWMLIDEKHGRIHKDVSHERKLALRAAIAKAKGA